jgi:hypothetical protein
MKSFRSYLKEMFEKPKHIPETHPDMVVPDTEEDPDSYLSGKWKKNYYTKYKHTFKHPVTGREHTIETDFSYMPYDNSAIVSFNVDRFYTNYQNRISDLSVASHIAKVVHGHVAHYAHHTGTDKLNFSIVNHEANKEKRSNLYANLARSLGLRAFQYADGQSTEVT